MARKIICAVIAMAFILSMMVFPATAEDTVVTAPTCTEAGVVVHNGETINVAPLGHDWGPSTVTASTSSSVTYTRTCTRCGATETVTDNELAITNYAVTIHEALPENVVKDGVISEGEYQRAYIPEQEIVLGNKGQINNGDNQARAQAIKDSAKLYMSFDAVHGVNFAVEYDSPEAKQTIDPTYYHGDPFERPGEDPSWFYSGDTWYGPQDGFMAQTAFIIQGYGETKGGPGFYYAIARSTVDGTYLRGHWFGNPGAGIQYGYDRSYRPADGDFVITYSGENNNHVVMEWSVPFSVLMNTSSLSDVYGHRYGFSITLTQGTLGDRDEYNNTSAVLFGTDGAFQDNAAKPTRTKTYVNPVTLQQIGAKRNGNLPMVVTFADDDTYICPEIGSSEEPTEPAISASLNLKDSVDVNFYVDNITSDMIADGYYVEYSLDGVNFTQGAFNSESLDSGNKYVFTPYSFAANQLTQEITFRLCNGEGVLQEYPYSVKNYCDYQIANSGNEGLKTLCGALMAYGYYAQQKFTADASAPINASDYEDAISNVADVTVSDFPSFTGSANCELGISASASLSLKSKTELNFYLNGVGNAEVVKVLVGGVEWANFAVEPVSATKCRIRVFGLRPVDLKSQIDLVCAEASISYSPMACAKAIVNSGGTCADVCKALYLFSTAAIDYFTD